MATGAILAGGASSRMGRDKSLLPLNGRTMIEHVIAPVREVCDPLCIVADRADDLRPFGLPVIPDRIRSIGPLGGIHAALHALDADEIVITGCDTPFLSADLLRYILNAPSSAPARVARAADGIHPLCGVYRREALPLIERCIASERLKLLDVLEDLGASIVDITPDLPFYHGDLFLNVNDPERLARVTELFRA
jgi:molybdopterin-guanine dinucleotide biosynthesis protein A